MTAATNHRITLARRPVGEPDATCFSADDVARLVPGPGEVLVEVEWLSIDPTIRGWMAQDTYLPAIEIRAPIRSGGIGTVIESNDEQLPVGAKVFFDTVGGDILEAAPGNLALRGRVVMCGAIATYNDTTPRPGPRNLTSVIINRGRMEGFIILDYMDRAHEATLELGGWLMQGELINKTDVVDGLDDAPAALHRLFTGANLGKVMVKL